MTPGEFRAKLRGFNEYQNQLHEREEELRIWQAWIGGYVTTCGFGGKLPELDQMIAEHRRAKNGELEPAKDEDEPLIKLAQEKGLNVPKGGVV